MVQLQRVSTRETNPITKTSRTLPQKAQVPISLSVMEGRVWVSMLTMTRTIGTAVDRNINKHLGMMMDRGWKLQVEAAKTNTLDAGRDIRGKMSILKARQSEQTTQIDTETPSIDTRVDTGQLQRAVQSR